MNKTQFYTLSGALLATTALSSAASAGTIGRWDANNNFTTTGLTISNTVFSATASTANAVVIGTTAGERDFGILYNNKFSGTTRFTTEFTISGARFITSAITMANVKLLLATSTNSSSIIGSISGVNGTFGGCTNVTTLVDLFVINDCGLTAGFSRVVTGLALTGVTFNNASGLATAGSSVSLTGRVYNPSNTSQIFEASSSGTILTSAEPLQRVVTAGADKTASATTTPTAFTSLTDVASNLSLTLATIRLSGSGALNAALSAEVTASTAATTSISVSSSLLSSAAVRSVTLIATAGGSTVSSLTAANFSSGTVTFSLTNTTWAAGNSVAVTVQFQGTTAIPAAVAGSVSGSVTPASGEASLAITGATAAVSQGGFRAEVNTFNASTNGPFGSYLRIHNNGQVAGVVTITIRNDAHTSGATLGSAFTTAAIQPGATMQLSAAEMEGTGTADGKLPSGGANVATADRSGSYTLSITGPIVGYVQHILFDGSSVADLSGYRNSGVTTNQP
jgi:hypothetical protein